MSNAPDETTFDFDAVFEVDDYMYFYQELLSDDLSDRQVEFLIRELALVQPMDILDLACGFGRHANRLAERGHRVTGLDRNPEFLELAQKDARRREVEVRYVPGDMRTIEFTEEFDRVLLLFTAFGYFEDEANSQVLHNVARALRRGGLFILDFHNRDTFVKRLLPYLVMEKGDDLMIDRHRFESETGRLYNRRIVIRDGIRRDKPHFIRLYSPTEIRSELADAGLEVDRMYGGWEAQPVTTENLRLVIIARKPEVGREAPRAER